MDFEAKQTVYLPLLFGLCSLHLQSFLFDLIFYSLYISYLVNNKFKVYNKHALWILIDDKLKTDLKRNNIKQQQHVVPKTYLKHFRISHGQNFLYFIDFANKYNKKVQKEGPGYKVFTKYKYYNTNVLLNNQAIEDLLGSYENTYNNIIKEITKETYISGRTLKELCKWLYISKVRSPTTREDYRQLMNFILKTKHQYNRSLTNEVKNKIENDIVNKSKEIHLAKFYDKQFVAEQANNFMRTLSNKTWVVLKAPEQLPFWTNDNPGFSPNLNPMFAKQSPFHNIMELNEDSEIFYVLTPKYCLHLIPEIEDLTNAKKNILFGYENATINMVDYINRGVLHTKLNLVISNKEELFARYLKRK